MTDRTEFLESALDTIPEGIALFDLQGEVSFWNQAAEAITGYSGHDLAAQPVPVSLDRLLLAGEWHQAGQEDAGPGKGELVHGRHKLGHELHAISRLLPLRNKTGERIGVAVVFHCPGSLDALPHGESGANESVKVSQSEMEDRLQAEFSDFERGGPPFGVLWITVDQAHEMRKTHGAMACEAMLDKLVHALRQGLRPAEEVGRWGDGEFLVLSHERSPEMLAAHARTLAGLARTADFRWWGDRLSLTVSIGAAQAGRGVTLAELLQQAKAAMLSSVHDGGNRIASAQGGQSCLPS